MKNIDLDRQRTYYDDQWALAKIGFALHTPAVAQLHGGGARA